MENQAIKYVPEKEQLNARTLNQGDFQKIDALVEKDMATARQLLSAGNLKEFNSFVFSRIGNNSKLWKKMKITQDFREKEKLLVYARSFKNAVLKEGLWKPRDKQMSETPEAFKHALE